IERRSRELLGLGFLALGAVGLAVLGSYSPDDPSFFAATDAPVENWLGAFGAAVAAPLYIVVGFGAWVLAAAALAWGTRLMVHTGTDRAVGRLIFVPVAV